jgi:hypothetical protein
MLQRLLAAVGSLAWTNQDGPVGAGAPTFAATQALSPSCHADVGHDPVIVSEGRERRRG